MERWLLLNDRHSKDEDIEEWLGKLRAALPDFEVVASRDDFQDRAASLGGFRGWIADVATGEDALGLPIFDAVVRAIGNNSDGLVLGKANADIVGRRLETGRRVYVVKQEDGRTVLFPAVSLEELPCSDPTATAILVLDWDGGVDAAFLAAAAVDVPLLPENSDAANTANADADVAEREAQGQ